MKYQELSQSAKEKAQLNMSNMWDSDWVIEYWKEQLEEMGYDGVEINYTGFSSQGDGASFTGGVDLEKWIKFNKLGNEFRSVLYHAKEGNVTAGIERSSSRYYHENTISATLENDYWYDEEDYPKLHKEMDNLQVVLLEKTQELCQSIYSELESDFDYQFTDEYMVDMCDANEYDFCEHGDLL